MWPGILPSKTSSSYMITHTNLNQLSQHSPGTTSSSLHLVLTAPGSSWLSSCQATRAPKGYLGTNEESRQPRPMAAVKHTPRSTFTEHAIISNLPHCWKRNFYLLSVLSRLPRKLEPIGQGTQSVFVNKLFMEHNFIHFFT